MSSLHRFASRAAAKTAQAAAILTALCLLLLSLPARAAEGLMAPIIEEVSPKTVSTVAAGSTKTVEVLAASDAGLTVMVGSTEIDMERAGSAGDGLAWFTGEYTFPASLAGKTLKVTATGTLNGRSQVKNGGAFTVVALENSYDGPSGGVYEGDMLEIEGAASFSGKQVTVTDIYADVFIPAENDREEDYAAPYYYQLPEGTIDYVSSGPDANGVYWLKSGRKVLASDVAVTANSGSQGENRITGISLRADSQCTYLSVDESWKAPFNIEVLDVTYASATSNSVTSFSPKKVRITFDYTTGIYAGDVEIPSGGCFTGVKVSTKTAGGIPQCVIELTLAKSAYYGAYASYYGNTLELKFYNPVSSLKGARIVIDSGHGSDTGAGKYDPGAIGSGGVQEAEENLRKATALRDELEARGAEVYLLPSYHTSDLYSLYDRVDAAIEWEPMVYVSVHHNSSSVNLSARGVEVYYNNPWSVNLAADICSDIFTAYTRMEYGSGALNRGHHFSEYAVTRVKQFAAVLIEYGFLTTPQECGILTNSSNIQKFAEATADGLEEYFSSAK